jgi:hypothetical protein
MTIEQTQQNHLETLQAVVANEFLTKESRTAAAKEIIRLTTAGQTGAPPDPHPFISDDDPDVLELTKPLDAEGLMLAEMPCFNFYLSPKSVPVAKTIIAGRRKMLSHLARIVDEELPEADRLMAVGAALAILAELAPLSYSEGLDLDSIRGMTPEWLLGHIRPWRHNEPPHSCGALVSGMA